MYSKRHATSMMVVISAIVTLVIPAAAQAQVVHGGGRPSVHKVKTATAQSKADANAKKAEPILVAIGDSITYGYNLGNNQAPSKLAFPFLIGEKVHDTVSDLAVPGWTTEDLLKALNTDQSMISKISQASVITIDVGSNDLLQPALPLLTSSNPTSLSSDEAQTLAGQLTSAVAAIGQNLTTIIQRVKDLNPKATVVLYDLYDPIPSSAKGLYLLAESAITAANLQIAKIALQNGIVVADAYDAFHGHDSYVRKNDVHPTVLGQQVLAQQGELALQLAPLMQTISTPQGWQSVTWWLGQQIVNLNSN